MSGQGRELGEYGLHAYTEVKTVSGNKLLIG
jgi:acyl-CoA reductase-like NAD-dependent aldehyde dehydrogenase